ncbi:hypothetical protein [Bythopirellula goksoeyrii]|uniref:Uncharacterized protein n=1 Tax=Bythopirellula goksoeyrii TaxID=1400387 RepID=A0A5B9QQR9_9BACT|nr:hypothetical protein [Bythopirellula goksoeyrii]QEG36313.1 hypothetical protein Pr1d_36260 [Bythopirellula goksoeyrii]
MSNSNSKPKSEQSVLDPFDPATLRLSQDYASTIGVKKVLTNISCRKPNRQEFVRVRAGEDWRVDTATFEDNIGRETYLVAHDLIPELAQEVKPVCLRLAINKQGDVFLWPVKLPGADGRTNLWHQSAVDASHLAEKRWLRITANMAAGMYDVFEATGDLKEPTWPEITFRDVLALTFKNRRIDSYEHPILKSLRGEL